jgi:glycosyltransferase involved in cell wall biosynthesis
MERTPLVTIVTPVYNGEKYLAECVDSVLRQTYQCFEYVIVDNYSKDATRQIAERFAAQDKRISVRSPERFLNVIENHNFAIEQAAPQSEYCKMVHADDRLAPECVQKMVELAELHPSVGLVSSYRLHGSLVIPWDLPYPSTVISGADITRASLLGEYEVFGCPSTTLLRLSVARATKPFYNEANRLHADTEAGYQALSSSDFGFVHQVLSFTRLHETSITTTSARRLESLMLVRLQLILKYGPKVFSPAELEFVKRRYLRYYLSFLGRALFTTRGTAFWDYHLGGLRELNCPLTKPKLCAVGITEAVKICFDLPRLGSSLKRALDARSIPARLTGPNNPVAEIGRLDKWCGKWDVKH